MFPPWAQDWIDALKPLDTVFLQGDVGVGKTTFAQYCIRRLVGRDLAVPSPTYPLMHTYTYGKGMITHMDLYRLDDFDACWSQGLLEPLGQGLCLIEWPERLGHHVVPDWVISIDQCGEGRQWSCQAGSLS